VPADRQPQQPHSLSVRPHASLMRNAACFTSPCLSISSSPPLCDTSRRLTRSLGLANAGDGAWPRGASA
jgi:hypothetical protein